jgi:hypothetical protein
VRKPAGDPPGRIAVARRAVRRGLSDHDPHRPVRERGDVRVDPGRRDDLTELRRGGRPCLVPGSPIRGVLGPIPPDRDLPMAHPSPHAPTLSNTCPVGPNPRRPDRWGARSGHRRPDRYAGTAGAARSRSYRADRPGRIVPMRFRRTLPQTLIGTRRAPAPGQLGLGDVLMIGWIALTLGWLGWEQLGIGLLAGLLLQATAAATLMALRHRPKEGGLPMGPASVAGWLMDIAWLVTGDAGTGHPPDRSRSVTAYRVSVPLPTVRVVAVGLGAWVGEGSVEQVAFARWGVRPAPAVARFTESGWSYDRSTVWPCPRCAAVLEILRKPYVSAGQTYRYVALVCPKCPSSLTMGEVGAKSYDALLQPPPGSAVGGPRPGSVDEGSSLPENVRGFFRSVGRRLRTTPAAPDGIALTPARELSFTAGDRQVVVGPPDHHCSADLRTAVNVRVIATGGFPVPRAPAPPRAVSDRALHWVKLTDPKVWRGAPSHADVRVLLPDRPDTVSLRERLAGSGVPFRAVRHWVEDEAVTTRAGLDLVAHARPCGLVAGFPSDPPTLVGPSAAAARDAFDLAWEANAPLPAEPAYIPAEQLVPEQWVPLLAHATFNPAQAQVVPHLLEAQGHVLVVAPTGAGKTGIGMVAALHTVLKQGRKAAWLVPQRSLTDELDRELQAWRDAGLRVERLSGEYAVDLQRVRDADVWVATTEKFEALCRAGSVQQALAEVGCLIVDEIHLLVIGNVAPSWRRCWRGFVARRRRFGSSGCLRPSRTPTTSRAGSAPRWSASRGDPPG